jgi:hypothetical protein
MDWLIATIMVVWISATISTKFTKDSEPCAIALIATIFLGFIYLMLHGF